MMIYYYYLKFSLPMIFSCSTKLQYNCSLNFITFIPIKLIKRKKVKFCFACFQFSSHYFCLLLLFFCTCTYTLKRMLGSQSGHIRHPCKSHPAICLKLFFSLNPFSQVLSRIFTKFENFALNCSICREDRVAVFQYKIPKSR